MYTYIYIYIYIHTYIYTYFYTYISIYTFPFTVHVGCGDYSASNYKAPPERGAGPLMRLAALRPARKAPIPPEQKSTRRSVHSGFNRGRHDAYHKAAGIPCNRVRWRPWRPSITARTLMHGHTKIKSALTANAPRAMRNANNIQTRTLRH